MSKAKKIPSILITLCFLSAILFGGAFSLNAHAASHAVTELVSRHGQGDNIGVSYNVSNAKGVLTVCVDGTKADIYVALTCDKQRYGYRLKPENKTDIPLNMGNGEYHMEIFAFVTGNQAEELWETVFTVELENAHAPYLNPSIIVNWTEDMELVKTAKSLIPVSGDKETALNICKLIAERYTYDEAASPPANYIPNLSLVYTADSGICYDLAALYAAMCRSAGIPCKLVMGYTSYMGMDQYHAWCLVYVGGEWRMIDPVYSIEKGSVFLNMEQTVETRHY